MISKEKQHLRKKIRSQIASMGKSQRDEESILLQTLLSSHPTWKQAQTIAFFYPLVEEPNVLPLLKSKFATWGFPDWNTKEMVFRQWTPNFSSLPSKEPVRPPKEAPEILPEKIDLILVPGLAFDLSGGRLGRGGGFYDRYLSLPTLRAYKLGIGFSIQKTPHVPIDTWDIRLDEVLFGS